MRFKSTIAELNTFVKLVASLNLLGHVTWLKLDDEFVRFTVIPEQGSQVWAVLPVNAIFDADYAIQSASDNNVINLEVPLAALHRALRSARGCSSASLRLTKKDNAPLLCLTINTAVQVSSTGRVGGYLEDGANDFSSRVGTNSWIQKETTISQDVPIRVLPASSLEGIHEPRCREPEVHIMLPPLGQVKMVSERFTRIAASSGKAGLHGAGTAVVGSAGAAGDSSARLKIKANMHGELSIGITTDALSVESRWKGLLNPDLDPNVVEGGEEGVRAHPSERWRHLQGEDSWATVRVDGKDWSRVLGVGRCGGRVVACFCDNTALILYVYLPRDGEDNSESCLTYYISSFSE